MADIASVTAKVQSILTNNFNNVSLLKGGGFSMRNGSARGIVEVQPFGEESVKVMVISPFLYKVVPSPELFEWVALNGGGYHFGFITAIKVDDGSITLSFEYSLLGDYLDEGELVNALLAVLSSANKIDDELKAKFGGEMSYED